MHRRFNVAGICFPDRHYMLPPLSRLPTLRGLIEEQAYMVLHAPRQSGKSTTLSALSRALTAEGRFCAVLLSAETGVPFPDDVGAAELPIRARWRDAARALLPPAAAAVARGPARLARCHICRACPPER